MMLRFRVRNVVPPGRRYFYEFDGVVYESLTMSGLLGIIRSKYQGSAPANLEAMVEDYMCRRLPEGFCYGTLDGRERFPVITISGVKQATMKIAAGNPRVTLGEARRRAEICMKCPMNDMTLCPSCVGVVSWARTLAGQSVGALEEWLGVCIVDQTAIAGKIHLSEIPHNDNYPDNCWRAMV